MGYVAKKGFIDIEVGIELARANVREVIWGLEAERKSNCV